MKNIIITATKKDIYISDNADTKELVNSLVQPSVVQGDLDSSFQITGQIKGFKNSVQGELFKKTSVQGILNNEKELVGTLEASSTFITGDIKIPFGNYDVYSGLTEIIPSFFEQTLNTEGKILNKDIKVFQIQTYETSNEFGTTFII